MRGVDLNRDFGRLLIAIMLAGLAVRAYGVGAQPPTGSEVSAVYTALDYVEHGEFSSLMPQHPQLRNLLQYMSIKMLGPSAWAVRGWAVMFGTLGIGLMGLLARRITGDARAGLLAALFLAIDLVHLGLSRHGIQEVYTAFFFLLGTWTFLEALDTGLEMIERPWLVAVSGVAFGLGLACKAHAAFPLAVCAVLAARLVYMRRNIAEAAYLVSALVVLPAAVFFLTYLPWFHKGYTLGEWLFMVRAETHYIAHHMGTSHDSYTDTQPWQWFLRPLMGYGDFSLRGGVHYVTVWLGNPISWMAVLPATVYVSVRRHAITGARLMLMLFAATYLPLVAAMRPIWVISSVGVMPFAYVVVAATSADLWARGWRRLAASVLIASVLASALLYPVTVGEGGKYKYLAPVMKYFNPHGQMIGETGPRRAD